MRLKSFIFVVFLLFTCVSVGQSQTYDERDARLMANGDSIKQLIRRTELAIAERKLILNIFINPVSNEILIHFKPNEPSVSSIKWYNENNQVIYSQVELRADEKNDIRLKIQASDLHLRKGKYKVLVRSKNKVYLKRIVFY